MAKNLKTRIKLRYDTLENWETNNPVLLAGELAVVAVPLEESVDGLGDITKPAILMKVGDGSTNFNDLPYSSGLSADVYAWAKAATKPTYTANEVNADAKGTAQNLINTLNVNDTVVSGQVVTGVKQVNGKIVVTRAPMTPGAEYTLESGTAADGSLILKKNGQKVGEEAIVKGWAELLASVNNKVNKVTGTVGNFVSFDAGGVIKDSGKKAEDFEATGTAQSLITVHNSSGEAHADIRAKIDSLGNALKFVGAGPQASRPQSGKDGDVYVATDTGKEFVWANAKWEEFGSGDHITKAQADGYYDAKGTAQELINNLNKVDVAVTNQYVTSVSEVNGVITVIRKQISYNELADKPAEKTTTFTAGEGLKVTGIDGGTVTYSFDDAITFILDGGTSAE